MPRVTKADLEAELKRYRERSRSRKLKAAFVPEPLSASALRALDVVCKHDRDAVIDELQKTIVKQAQEIAQLKVDMETGNIPMGPILASRLDAGFFRNRVLTNKDTVKEYVTKLFAKISPLSSLCLFGDFC